MHTLAKEQDQYFVTMLDVLVQKQNSLVVYTVHQHSAMTTLKMLGFDVPQVSLSLQCTC